MLARKGFWLRGKPHQSGSIQFHWESETKQGFFPAILIPFQRIGLVICRPFWSDQKIRLLGPVPL